MRACRVPAPCSEDGEDGPRQPCRIPRPPSSPGSFLRVYVCFSSHRKGSHHTQYSGSLAARPSAPLTWSAPETVGSDVGVPHLPETWAASALPHRKRGGTRRSGKAAVHQTPGEDRNTHTPSQFTKRKVRQLGNTHSHHRPKGRAGGPRLFPGGCAPTDGRATQAADKSQRIRLLSAPILDLLGPQTLPELAADVQLQLPVDSLLAPGSRLWTWLFHLVCCFNYGKSTQHTLRHLSHLQACRSGRPSTSVVVQAPPSPISRTLAVPLER